jgi:predicted O-methyltransferase YrrM
MDRIDWEKAIEESFTNSLKLYVPAIRMEDAYVIYSVAYLTSLRFGWLSAIDAGAGVGFSTVWMAKALYESSLNGRIYSIEKDAERFHRFKELVDKYGLKHLITLVNDDALEYVESIENELNLVFIDIEKDYYLDFFNRVKDKVVNGGVVLAHNVKRHRGTIKEFLEEASKGCWRTIIVPTGEGVSLSIKTDVYRKETMVNPLSTA